MRNRERPDPVIPDHEVLRRIGAGAYGEVWLARGVTGALRAVKVVWREDFEDERGFEREFEGILKYEPISRDHPGLVNVLHVGRAPDAASFYYYVMELGDDVRTGHEINPIEYEPRTLRTDMQAAGRRPLATEACIDAGLRLAEALDHLHEHGLAHRDVKPSNVIFVSGRAKLADIGLVAARGQRTFVGTEGFVPPEGPGTAQADVYSLGKVLYECATGKDRLEFPELPDEIAPAGKERRLWLSLNHVICDVCEPQVSRRQIRTAAELAEALRALQRGKRHRTRTPAAAWLTAFFLLVFLAAGTWEWMRHGPYAAWLDRLLAPVPPSPQVLAMNALVRVVSHPEGADVLNVAGKVIGATPLTVEVKVGQRVRFTVRRAGFRTLEIDQTVPASATGEPLVVGDVLQVFAPPQAGEPWTDPLGNRYQAVGEKHVATGFVGPASWRTFEDEEKWHGKKLEIEVADKGVSAKIMLVDAAAANAYCGWLARISLRDGYLTDEEELWAERDEGFERPEMPAEARASGLRPFRPVARPVAYGVIEVTTRPEGAEVYVNREPVGSTYGPLVIERLRPGSVELSAQLGGYREKRARVQLGRGEHKQLEMVLEQNQSVVFGTPWQNGLGMRFVPVGKELMVAVWETRVIDYGTYVRENKRPPPPMPDFKQGPDHPVVMVSRDDAEAFCRWLTKKERADQRIAWFDEYRLPTDLEWSRFVGLEDDESATPAERDARRQHFFPWGDQWPPGDATGLVGNLADETALRLPGMRQERTIPGYIDGFEATAPVGSFAANALGLHDAVGNVQEWVADAYSPRQNLGVLRGGGWNTYQAENLYSGARNTAPPNFHDAYYGFRVVLAKTPATAEDDGAADKPKNEISRAPGKRGG